MKITSGKYKNRKLETLNGTFTRPTSAKIRGAIFNSLGQHFTGGQVLDLFSGSGAMAIEAISRGFTHAVCVDNSSEAIKVIKQNVQALDLAKQIDVSLNDYRSFLTKVTAKGVFDLIIVDPPYEMMVIEEIAALVASLDLLAEKGTIVFEYSNKVYRDIDFKWDDTFVTVFERKYDTTSVVMVEKFAEGLKEEL